MEARTPGAAGGPTARTETGGTGIRHTGRRLTTETKQAFKTTEFWLTVAVIVGILISAAQISGGEGDDTFIAPQAWLYVAILTGLYAVGRGLAKSGSRDPYDADDDRH